MFVAVPPGRVFERGTFVVLGAEDDILKNVRV